MFVKTERFGACKNQTIKSPALSGRHARHPVRSEYLKDGFRSPESTLGPGGDRRRRSFLPGTQVPSGVPGRHLCADSAGRYGLVKKGQSNLTGSI